MSDEAVVFELKPQPWMKQANCVGADPALFFPERGEPSSPAKAICMACPVRVDCLNYALSINERQGIWGGTSENERRGLRRQWTGTRRRQRPHDADQAGRPQKAQRDPDALLGAAPRGRRLWTGRF
jgi:WhiB family redox-sensing transcriptional regulator